MPDKKSQIYQLNDAYEKDDLFAFRTLLRNSTCHGVFPDTSNESHIHLHVKKKTALFDTLSDKNVSVFEKILSSNDDKSAKYICLIWKEFELWKKKEVLTWSRNENEKLPFEFVLESTKNRNLFSFLVFDWHNPNRHMGNHEKKYYLELKNKQMIDKTQKSLFQYIYEIIENGEVYHEVCLRIIYEYLAEMDQRVKEEENAEIEESKDLEYHEDSLKLLSIDDVLKMKNKEYQAKILEIFVTYFDIFDKTVENRKDEIIKATESEESDDKTFFNLAFQLIERQHNQFENDFTDFIASTKATYGHYYETILKPVVRLLLRMAEIQNMAQVETFIYNKCPYIELNSSPLTNFQEFYKFNNKNIFPFNDKEMRIYVSMKIYYKLHFKIIF